MNRQLQRYYLRPCKECGGPARMHVLFGLFFVDCDICGKPYDAPAYEDENDAIINWNKED